MYCLKKINLTLSTVVQSINCRFILAKEAFELLFDKTARADYDRKKEGERVRDEKQRARMEKADGDRKRFMEDLERREKEFEEQRKRKPQVLLMLNL